MKVCWSNHLTFSEIGVGVLGANFEIVEGSDSLGLDVRNFYLTLIACLSYTGSQYWSWNTPSSAQEGLVIS